MPEKLTIEGEANASSVAIPLSLLNGYSFPEPLDCPMGAVRISQAARGVLELLRKGNAFYVRGSWRFRGVRRSIPETNLLSLMKYGLAELVHMEGYRQYRITASGKLFR